MYTYGIIQLYEDKIIPFVWAILSFF